jgi:hypothetical protein
MADYLYFADGTAEAVEELDMRALRERMHMRSAEATYWVFANDETQKAGWVMCTMRMATNRSITEDEVPESVRMLHLIAGGC